MQDIKNPLQRHFKAILFVMLFDLLEFSIKFIRGKGPSEIFDSHWSIIHKIIVFVGFGTFLYLYIHKKLSAWHTLTGTLAALLPMLFYINLRATEKISSMQIRLVILFLWFLLCIDVLFRYKSYKKYITGNQSNS